MTVGPSVNGYGGLGQWGGQQIAGNPYTDAQGRYADLQAGQLALLYSQRGLQNAILSDGSIVTTRRRSIAERWESRMLRMKQKKTERRLEIIKEAAWRVGIVWGSMAIVGVTVWMFGILLRMTLG